MRDEHCNFAIFNADGRCIAACHHNWKVMFDTDCKGVERGAETDLKQRGREYQIGGRFKKNHGIKLQ